MFFNINLEEYYRYNWVIWFPQLLYVYLEIVQFFSHSLSLKYFINAITQKYFIL